MGYRTLNVDGVKYEYIIGKTHTKIRGIRKVFENKKIGSLFPILCKCCGEKQYDDYSNFLTTIRVTPSNVANAIRSLK